MHKSEWTEVRNGGALPILGQLVMVCSRTYRQPPYSTRYEMARFTGGDVAYQWRGMDGIAIRDAVLYWRELMQYELPFEL